MAGGLSCDLVGANQTKKKPKKTAKCNNIESRRYTVSPPHQCCYDSVSFVKLKNMTPDEIKNISSGLHKLAVMTVSFVKTLDEIKNISSGR